VDILDIVFDEWSVLELFNCFLCNGCVYTLEIVVEVELLNLWLIGMTSLLLELCRSF